MSAIPQLTLVNVWKLKPDFQNKFIVVYYTFIVFTKLNIVKHKIGFRNSVVTITHF